MAKIPAINKVAFLVHRKLDELQDRKRSSVSKMPYTTESTAAVIRDFKTYTDDDNKLSPIPPQYREASRRYIAELDGKSEDELHAMYNEELAKKHKEDDQNSFFNKPSAEADFDYWSKMAHWTLDEAIALSFGKSPNVVNEANLSKIVSWTSPFVREYQKTTELAKRAVVWEKLFDPVIPKLFIKWAKDTDIPLPDELVEKVEVRSGKLLDWKKMYEELLEKNNNNVQIANATIAEKDAEIAELQSQAGGEKSLGTKERESLLKMVIAMAVDGYGYETDDKRSPIPQQISDALARRGTSLDVGTVRKWLKEAAEHFPGPQDDDVA